MRIRFSLLAALFLALGTLAQAQLVGEWFTRPDVLDLINPIVGKGAQYQITPSQQNIPPMTEEVTVLAKESVEGREGFWLETAMQGEKQDRTGYMKILMSITKTDFKVHRMITQGPGRPAMEIPLNGPAADDSSDHTPQKDFPKWRNVGTELITVPAGVFSCKHWQVSQPDPEGLYTDMWTSEKVTPYGIVKETGPKGSMVLLKLVTDAQDHITGPVTKFDPMQMQREAMEKMQQKQQQKQKPPQP